jgi:hypothetical protein
MIPRRTAVPLFSVGLVVFAGMALGAVGSIGCSNQGDDAAGATEDHLESPKSGPSPTPAAGASSTKKPPPSASAEPSIDEVLGFQGTRIGTVDAADPEVRTRIKEWQIFHDKDKGLRTLAIGPSGEKLYSYTLLLTRTKEGDNILRAQAVVAESDAPLQAASRQPFDDIERVFGGTLGSGVVTIEPEGCSLGAAMTLINHLATRAMDEQIPMSPLPASAQREGKWSPERTKMPPLIHFVFEACVIP